MQIGRLKINLEKRQQKGQMLAPRTNALRIFGFSVSWLNASSLNNVNAYLDNASVYTVVNRIVKTASFAPFKVYRIKDQQKHLKYKAWTGENATRESVMMALRIKNLAYEEDNDHPLNKLISNPNPHQKQRSFIEASIGFKLLTGERFWHVTRLAAGANEGKPYSINNLPPHYMAVIGDGTLFGIKEYELNLGRPTKIPVEEIIFSRYWNPEFDTTGGHLRGLAPLRAGRKNTTRSDAAIERSTIMIKNAGAAGILFDKSNIEMSVEQAGKLKRVVNDEILGLENSNLIRLANGDMGYINFGLKSTEMELLATEKRSFEVVAHIFSAPPGLWDADKASLNNAKEFKKELLTMACIPELDSIRDDFNEIAKLYPDDDIYVDYDIMVFPELQEDLEKLKNIAKDSWWMTGNEKRLSMYMDEDTTEPMMGKYLVPTGLTDISDLDPANMEQEMDRVDEEENNEDDRGN